MKPANSSQSLYHPILKEGIAVIRKHLAHLGVQPGVYQMHDAQGNVLYIGKARMLKQRVASYTRPNRLPIRIQRMIAATRKMEFITTQTEGEALLLEANLIKKLTPHYNILLRDDKSFPSIWITDHDNFPRVSKHRGTRKKTGKYFGPYASASAVNNTLVILQRIFGLRDCTDYVLEHRARPCLQYHIKRCSGPCAKRISQDEYQKNITHAVDFLNGKTHEVQTQMAKQMETASQNLDFERAAKIRDQIKALAQIQSHQDIHFANIKNADLFAFVRQGSISCIQAFFIRNSSNNGGTVYFPKHDASISDAEIMSAFIGQFYVSHHPAKQILVNCLPQRHDLLQNVLSQHFNYTVEILKPQRGDRKRSMIHAINNAQQAMQRKTSETINQIKLLDRLGDLCGLKTTPERIEIYDNSHIQGSHAIGAMVVAGKQGFIKKAYRKFNIQFLDNQSTQDDYAMISQVMKRRFTRILHEEQTLPKNETNAWPDIVILDGGKGQLSAATSVFQELDICGRFKYFAVSKGPDRNAGVEELHFPTDLKQQKTIRLEANDQLQFFIQRLRDESHRFVIGAHRQKRAGSITRSSLDDIPTIGAKRKRLLLRFFGSSRAVANASLQDLEAVETISKNTAAKIYEYFHPQSS